MRYREGISPDNVAALADRDIAVGTAVFGLVSGVGFVVAGIRGRQMWLASLGASLCIASLMYLAALAAGY